MKIYLLADNVRSCYNVGSLFRLADATAVTKLYLTGYTPYPLSDNDARPRYVAAKTSKEIAKTALESFNSVAWEHDEAAIDLIEKLKKDGVTVVAVEQSSQSINYINFIKSITTKSQINICFVLGHETEGLSKDVIKACDAAIEIPMLGAGKSLNVAMAATVVIYSLLQLSSGGVA
ncbi:MAG: TrmH family RNA methyltransferase [candidate division WWE3 bacterium]|nr:TrmH family RNA methyltransferase [candidate division WWE3 bacterium]